MLLLLLLSFIFSNTNSNRSRCLQVQGRCGQPPQLSCCCYCCCHSSSVIQIVTGAGVCRCRGGAASLRSCRVARSEEHTSVLQSHSDLVCGFLLEEKKWPASAAVVLLLLLLSFLST